MHTLYEQRASFKVWEQKINILQPACGIFWRLNADLAALDSHNSLMRNHLLKVLAC